MWERNGNTWIYGGNEAINVRPVRYKDGRVLWTGYWKDERVPHILPDQCSDVVMRRAERYFDSRIELDSYAALPPKRLPVDAATHVHKLGVLVAEV